MIRHLIITASLFSLAIPAQAKAPSLLPVQGTVADGDGQPLDGEFTVQFSLYSDALGGDALYQETQPVNFRNGHFFAYVGDGGTLDLSIFKNNDAIYLGLKMGEDPEMRPRILLASAAYAAYANESGNAEKLGGKTAEEYALKADTATLTWNDVQDIPEAFNDGIDNDTTYTASTGLALHGTAFSVDRAAVEAWSRNACYDTEAELRAVLDQFYLNSGSGNIPWSSISSLPPSFADGIDDDTLYSAGVALNLSGTTFDVDQASVESWIRNVAYDHVGELRAALDAVYLNQSSTVTWNTITGLPPGFADGIDDDTTYSAGNGLNQTGTTFSLNQASVEGYARGVAFDTESELTALLDDNYLGANYAPTWNMLSGVPQGFQDGIDNDTTYSAGNGIDQTGTTFSLNQASVEGYARGVAFDTESELTALLDDNYLSTNYAPAWNMLSGVPQGFEDGIDNDTTYTASTAITLVGNSFAVNRAAIESWISSRAYTDRAQLRAVLDAVYLNESSTIAWSNITSIPPSLADGTDNDTTYTAGNGLDLSGTQFAVNQSTIEAWARGVAYDTEAEITPLLDQYYSSTGSGNVSWSNISNLPPTLADGVDDDTTYSAGNGLDLSGTQFVVNQSTIEAWARGVAYDTEAELTNLLDDNYLGSGYVPAWGNLSGMPGGFADGTDNDTTYTAGNGLALNGTSFSANQTTIEAWARGVAYDTEAELTNLLDDNYLGTAYVPAWGNLSGMPGGFADGTDNDTTYTASTGLALDGNQFSIHQSTIEAWARDVAYDTEAELRTVLDQYYSSTGSGNVSWSNISNLPPTLADGVDDDTTYAAGNGLALNGTTFSANQSTIEAWARGVAYDTEAELTNLLDDNYLGSGYVPAWANLTDIPAGFADGTDNDTTYTAGNGLDLSGTTLSVNQSTIEAWARSVAYDTEAELTNLLDDNYLASGYLPAWANLTDIPAGFADGTDNDTTYAAGTGLDLSGTTLSVNQSTIETWVASLAYTEVAQLRAALDAVYLNESSTVAWANVTGIPASLADGVDDDTTYTASGPITLNGTEINMITCQQDEVLQWDSGAWTCASLPSTNSPSGSLQVCRVGSSTCLGTYTHQRLVGSHCDNDFIACGTYYYLSGTGANATPRSAKVWNMATTSLYYSRVGMTTDGRTYYENPDCDESGDKYIEESGRNAYAASFRWAIAAERGTNRWTESYRDSNGCRNYSSRYLLSDGRELKDSGTGLRAYELRMQ